MPNVAFGQRWVVMGRIELESDTELVAVLNFACLYKRKSQLGCTSGLRWFPYRRVFRSVLPYSYWIPENPFSAIDAIILLCYAPDGGDRL